jgi:hypothetical protein
MLVAMHLVTWQVILKRPLCGFKEDVINGTEIHAKLSKILKNN